MNISITKFLILCGFLVAGCNVQWASNLAMKLLVTTTDNQAYDIAIAQGLNMKIGPASLQLTSSDKTLNFEIQNVKSIHHIADDDLQTDLPVSALHPSFLLDGNILRIITDYSSDEFSIFDLEGKLIMNEAFHNSVDIDLSHINADTYIIRLSSGKSFKFLLK